MEFEVKAIFVMSFPRLEEKLRCIYIYYDGSLFFPLLRSDMIRLQKSTYHFVSSQDGRQTRWVVFSVKDKCRKDGFRSVSHV